MRFRSLLSLAVVFAIFVAGCEKTNDPSDTKPVLTIGTVSVPAFPTNSSDTCGTKAYSYASSVQMFLALANAYVNPAMMTQVNGVWTYSVTEDGVTVTITASKQGDGSYRWYVKLNGTDVTDNTVYTNWTLMDATTSADGKSGSLNIYSSDPNPSTTVEVAFNWSTGANNLVTYNMEIPAENVRIEVRSNGTTGETTEYMRTSATSPWVATGFHATWTTSGGAATC